MSSMRSLLASAVLVFLLLATGTPRFASAADTTECYAVGPTNFELYMSMDGLGLPSSDQSLGNQIVLGYGLSERVSGYLSTVLSADGDLIQKGSEIATGLYGTPWDTDHLDLDIFLGFNNRENDGFTVGPGLELNWDAAPDLAAWGLYTRGGLAISGHSTPEGSDRTTNLTLTLGAYWTITCGRQLLLELDGVLKNDNSNEFHLHDVEREWVTGGWVLGYNASLNKTMEFITQVSLNVPENREDYSFGLMLGFIATLPSNF